MTTDGPGGAKGSHALTPLAGSVEIHATSPGLMADIAELVAAARAARLGAAATRMHLFPGSTLHLFRGTTRRAHPQNVAEQSPELVYFGRQNSSWS
jgi:hypothetical protein